MCAFSSAEWETHPDSTFNRADGDSLGYFSCGAKHLNELHWNDTMLTLIRVNHATPS